MKNKLFFILILLVLTIALLSTGCEKNGKIRIVNRTDHLLYAGIGSSIYEIPDSSATTINVSTGTKTPFTGDVGKYVNVGLQGETYQIWDSYLERYVDSTFVWVKAGETTSIYVQPNRASVKVKNLSGQHIKQVVIRRNTSLTSAFDTYFVDIPNGTTWFKPISYATTTNNFYLTVEVEFDDDNILIFGGPQFVFGVDEQFLIEIPPLIE